MKSIFQPAKHAFLMTLLMALLLGGVVPVIFTAVAQLLFPTVTHGNLLLHEGKVIGSSLLGQEFVSQKYFWGRPSATTPAYNATASAASNYSFGNANLLEKANERMRHYATRDGKIPLSLITASGSGLDPHITPKAAAFQMARVAKARNIPQEQLAQLLADHTDMPYLGFIGVPRVNVLKLNLALDALHDAR